MTSKSAAPVVYGIPNCSSVKNARTWLSDQGLAYEFHDFKKQGVPEAALEAWMASAGWQTVLNRKGTSWRQLDSATQAGVTDAASARRVILQQPSLIKRPVIQWPSGRITIGYQPEHWPA